MFAPFLTAFAVTALGVALCLRWGERWGLVDRPSGDRKRHAAVKPVAGGGLALGVLVSSALFAPSEFTWGVLLGGGGMALMGLDDDRNDRPPLHKLSSQIVFVALALAVTGVSDGVRLGDWVLGAPWTAVVAFVWVLSLTNAFNLIDGSDGLAAGVAALIAGTLLSGGGAGTTLAAALLAGCVAFWTVNRPPARAFWGDGGSYLLGFCFGMLSLHEGTAAFDLLAWSLVFALPLGDTASAILRRLRTRQPIFAADHRHIHHRLEARWGTWPMLAALYAITLLCATWGLWWAGWWR